MRIRTVGVVGLGMLGRGIAACLLAHGFDVIGFDRRPATRRKARKHIDKAIHELVEQAQFPRRLTTEWIKHYRESDSLKPLGASDFVIESVIEDIDAKRKVFDEIEAIARPNTPIASNTSALPITELQASRKYPRRFIGMHWAEPAHITRFMELIRGELTSASTLKTAAMLGRRLGKEASIVRKDVPGFIVNRLAYAVYREALHLLESGVADMETIDRSFRNAFGIWAVIVGPFRWIDITGGPELYAKAMRGVLPTLSNMQEPPPTMKNLAESGARGIVNHRGFYQYSEAEAKEWQELVVRHAWNLRRLTHEYFPSKNRKTRLE